LYAESVRTPAFLFALSAVCSGCASDYNTVRLKQKKGSDILSLRTQHYLQTDGDHVQEIERGERMAEFNASRRTSGNGDIELTLKVTLRLYEDDAPPALAGQLDAGGKNVPLQIAKWSSTDLQEKVTVLDTGQRPGTNGALTSEVQAQTGYITFGKPTAAGSVQRRWRVYSGEISDAESFVQALRLAGLARVRLLVGTTEAKIEFKPNQIKAWQRFARGEPDKISRQGD
jgi:hypothetical protein